MPGILEKAPAGQQWGGSNEQRERESPTAEEEQNHHQGLKTICSSGNNSSAEVRADPLLAEELNTFYGRFECNVNGGAILPISTSGSSRQSSDVCAITFSEDDVRRELKRVNVRKAAGPDGITGRVLRSCADQLAGLFTSIFNESLATSVVPTSFKKSVIIPVPKNSKPSCLNDYRPVALTSTVMKVFERLLKKHICSSIPATLDPLQFAYRPNRSTDDAISQVLHSSLTHIDSKNGNYVRLLFIDYSSAFNTIVPTKLAVKLSDLGLNTSLCDWIQDFLTARPQVVKVGQFTSNSITLNVGAPQGCVLSPLLYSLYCRLQEETAAALHSSYDQRDPCGEGEQLQVPRCKHLRGPDMDCTHPNTGQESQAKAVPSATAEKIQGLTSYPENFLFRGHRKCTDSVHLSVV